MVRKQKSDTKDNAVMGVFEKERKMIARAITPRKLWRCCSVKESYLSASSCGFVSSKTGERECARCCDWKEMGLSMRFGKGGLTLGEGDLRKIRLRACCLKRDREELLYVGVNCGGDCNDDKDDVFGLDIMADLGESGLVSLPMSILFKVAEDVGIEVSRLRYMFRSRPFQRVVRCELAKTIVLQCRWLSGCSLLFRYVPKKILDGGGVSCEVGRGGGDESQCRDIEPPSFPPRPCSQSEKERVIDAWVKNLRTEDILESGCAVCGILVKSKALLCMDVLKEHHLKLLVDDKDVCNDIVGACTRMERKEEWEEVRAFNGPVLDEECDGVCVQCYSALEKGRAPLYSLSNGFWLGRVPEELCDLTWMEKLLIRKTRLSMCVARVHTSGRGMMSGSVMAFPTPVADVYRILPPAVKELEEMLVCIAMGSKVPEDGELKRMPLFVRRNKIRRALEWLKLNHIDYKTLVVSEENLNEYGENEIPVRIVKWMSGEAHNRISEATAVFDNELDVGSSEGVNCPFVVNGLVPDTVMDDNYHEVMRAKAVLHLQTGQLMLGVGHGEKFVNSFDNCQYYPTAFPWLFPYGLGGVGNDRRNAMALRSQIGSEMWLKRLVMYYDKRFQMDEQFCLTAFSNEQRRQSNRSMCIKTKRKDFDSVARDIVNVDTEALRSVAEKMERGEKVDASNEGELQCLRILRQVTGVARHVKGSVCSRLKMRKQLWSTVAQKGAPTWFITISPPEHKSMICLYFADGKDTIDIGQWSESEARKVVAKNSVAAARYFNFVVNLVIGYVVGKKFDDGRGLFGPVDCYYGTVEQQGRLTLHLHLLVWIKDSLTPDEVRARLLSNDRQFECELLAYIESCQTGDMMPISIDSDGSLSSVVDEDGSLLSWVPDIAPKVCVDSCGGCDICVRNRRFWDGFNIVVNGIVRRTNFHICRRTSCGKSEFTDCKARFPRETVGKSHVDDNGHIYMEKHEEMMNEYNPVLTYLARCNTDVTCLMSGTAVKSVIAYVTDYISKTQLRTSTMMDIVTKVVEGKGLGGDENEVSESFRARRVLLQMVNRLTSHQEMGSPMACMYLIGDPDHYTNLSFVPFLWTQYVSFMLCGEDEVSAGNADTNFDGRGEELVELVRKEGEIVSYHTVDDYVYRPKELEGVCLLDFVRMYEKRSKSRLRVDDVVDDDIQVDGGEGLLSDDEWESEESNGCSDDDMEGDDASLLATAGRKRRRTKGWLRSQRQEMVLENFEKKMRKIEMARNCLRGAKLKFFEFVDGHPKKGKTVLVNRKSSVGKETILEFVNPLPRRSVVEGSFYACTLLTLLKPWRSRIDLVENRYEWENAFESECVKSVFSDRMKYFNVLYECNDARDDFSARRKVEERLVKQHAVGDLLDRADAGVTSVDLLVQRDRRAIRDREERLFVIAELGRVGLLDEMPRNIGAIVSNNIVETSLSSLEHASNLKACALLEEGNRNGSSCVSGSIELGNPVWDRRSGVSSDVEMLDDGRVRLIEYNGTVLSGEEGLSERERHMSRIADEVCRDYGLNEEQRRAYKIITNQVLFPDAVPIRLYIGGMGGTGKSQILNAVMQFFRNIGCSDKFAALAPTGTAASLIRGMTYHTFLGLGRQEQGEEGNGPSRHKITMETKRRIRETDFLFLDEISMISCLDLYTIDSALSSVRPISDHPFGGVNMIVAGDFAQLPPVILKPLYCSLSQLKRVRRSQENLIGKFLWSQFTDVVILKKNMRQLGSDEVERRFRRLLENLRFKCCDDCDIDLLRQLNVKNKSLRRVMTRTTAVITRSNTDRDAINDVCSDLFAEEVGESLKSFYSVDTVSKSSRGGKKRKDKSNWIEGTLSREEQVLLHELPCARTEKVPGILKLCRGLPVLLKRNDATGLGVTNGAEGVVVGWDERYDFAIGQNVLKTVFVELKSPGIQVCVKGLPVNVVPVVHRTEVVECRHLNGMMRKITRDQVPINANFAMTDYASQGKSRVENAVFLRKMDSFQSVYTALSRGTSADKTIILDEPNLEAFVGGLKGDPLLREFKHLELLDLITSLKMDGSLHEDVKGDSRVILMRSFLRQYGLPETSLHKETSWSQRDWDEVNGAIESESDLSTLYKNATRSKRMREENREVSRKLVKSGANKRTSGTVGDGIGQSDNILRNPVLRSLPKLCWDQQDWSCAYDVCLISLFGVWIDFKSALVDVAPDLVDVFSHIDDGTIAIDRARDDVRRRLHQLDASLFPFGNTTACVIDVLKFLLLRGQVSVVKSGWCVDCAEQHIAEFSTIGFSPGDHFGEAESFLSRCGDVSVEDWVRFLLGEFRLKCDISKGIVSDEVIESCNVPPLIFVERYPTSDMLVNKVLKVGTFVGVNSSYSLSSILYLGGNHFVCRVFRSDGSVWYVDGQQDGGIEQNEGMIDCMTEESLTFVRSPQSEVSIKREAVLVMYVRDDCRDVCLSEVGVETGSSNRGCRVQGGTAVGSNVAVKRKMKVDRESDCGPFGVSLRENESIDSSVYDSILFAFFHAWLEESFVLKGCLNLDHMFSVVRGKERTFEDQRDVFVKYLVESRGMGVGVEALGKKAVDVVKAILPKDGLGMRKEAVCTGCSVQVQYSQYQVCFNARDDERALYATGMMFRYYRNANISMTMWISYVLNHFDRYCDNVWCISRRCPLMVQAVEFSKLPLLLVIEITQEMTNVTIDEMLKVRGNMGIDVDYVLMAVIYYGQDRYVVRLIRADGNVWLVDGRKAMGRPKYECRLGDVQMFDFRYYGKVAKWKKLASMAIYRRKG